MKIFRKDMIDYHPKLKVTMDELDQFLDWVVDPEFFKENFNKEPNKIERQRTLHILKMYFPLPKEFGGHEKATLEDLREITKSGYFYWNMSLLNWFLNNGNISNLTTEMKEYLHNVLLVYSENFDDPIYKQLLDKFNWND